MAVAREFWGDALNLDVVRSVESPVARLTGRAFVTWNTIHWPGALPTTPDDPAVRVVIHEMAHCWQHQQGRWQILRGVVEQSLYTVLGWWLVRLGLRPLYDPYDFGGPDGVASAASLRSFRLEAQAAIIEYHWVTSGRSTPFADDLARLCRDVGIGAVAAPDRTCDDS